MKRFRFTLDTVKRLRADAEQSAQAELARSLGAHAAASRARDARSRSLDAARDRLARPKGFAHQLALAELEVRAASLRLEGAVQVESEAEAEVGRSRGDLVEASRALEMLERLETARRQSHRAAQLREDEAIAQEITEARAARRAQMRRHA